MLVLTQWRTHLRDSIICCNWVIPVNTRLVFSEPVLPADNCPVATIITKNRVEIVKSVCPCA